jgi:tripartite-type tricarboxylate transporter receptor subunit TctC
VNNTTELVAYAKAESTKVNVGHAGVGVGNHLTGLLVTASSTGLAQVLSWQATALTAAAWAKREMLIDGATAAPF